MVLLPFCILLPFIAVIIFRIDTVEVNGSSPFGPTICFLEAGKPFPYLHFNLNPRAGPMR